MFSRFATRQNKLADQTKDRTCGRHWKIGKSACWSDWSIRNVSWFVYCGYCLIRFWNGQILKFLSCGYWSQTTFLQRESLIFGIILKHL